MVSNKKISVVEDYYPRPKWRYRDEGEGSGEVFREDYLAPALRKFDSVEVDLTGYNRYGPSFISEAFGGLVRDEGFDYSTLKEKLKIRHDKLDSIESWCWDEIKKADRATK
ncbi:TPA: STAS-like domain-containing protein [Vibrio parahaemolyticus]